ncbi:MAG: SLC13 family permease, partial [Gemmatimonadetes bacterium]|nr:SLC13 family permease [Gemmatimonadota bacterium]NIV22976.1 SLC13 family permease [Gemmatimonadota bacterium]NIW75788.1 SLC13 family permease [Gemmatimonadota bacterium]NIY35010.1 SLC13 family permease [Gemmatimonadota bacterium]
SKLLIPLSFAGILGGICTFIGTSTNIIVGSILEEQGYPPFRMFEFTPLGSLFLFLGVAYLLLFGRRLLPSRRSQQEDLTEDYHLREYLTE